MAIYNLQPFHSTVNEKNEINLNNYYLFTSVEILTIDLYVYYIRRVIKFSSSKIFMLLSLFLFFYYLKGKKNKSKKLGVYY